MASRIKGITIQLIEKTQTGTDSLNRPIYSEKTVNVQNVLVGEPSSSEIDSAMSLYGKQVKYTLGIPKGDTHIWTDTKVILPDPFGGTYMTIGEPTAGIENMIPLDWNKKVMVERFG